MPVAVVRRRTTKKNLEAMGLEVRSSADYQLDRLRGQGMLTEFNPSYDFFLGGNKYSLEDLTGILRRRLTLVK